VTAGNATEETTTPRVGFVGLGTMGSAMAANLGAGGLPAHGVEPDTGSSRVARELGAVEVRTPREVAQRE
jgi:3-hydroxyisobutyrate dehydrogenase-like beta-hydroxyacid dehydrogenase